MANESLQLGITKELEESLRLGVPTIPMSELLNHAQKNKMLLHALRRLNVEGPARAHEEARHARFLRALEETLEALRGTDYSLFKVLRPIEYVPADIDVLLSQADQRNVLPRLEHLGMKAEAKDKYCLTFTGRCTLDLYTQPNFADIVYLNANELLKYRTEARIGGIAVTSLRSGAEAAVVMAHAAYKEQILTLNDKMTIQSWRNEDTLAILENAGGRAAYSLITALAQRVEAGELQVPYRIPFFMALSLYARKATQDKLTRSTLLNAVSRVAGHDSSKRLVSRLKRTTY